MREFLALLLAQARVFLRSRTEPFFTLVLPIVFLVIFGFVWGRERPVVLGLSLAMENADLLSVLEGRAGLMVERFADRASLVDAVQKRVVDFGLAWNGEELEFVFEASRIQDHPTHEQMAQGIAWALALKLSGRSEIIEVERVHLGKLPGAGWFHHAVPGILTLPILSAGMFAVAGRLTGMRERFILQPLWVTPMRPWALLFALGALRLALAYVGALLSLGFATVVFGARFAVSWGMFLPLVLASGLAAMGLGTVIALLVRRPGSAGLLANILLQVMLFLSGIYVPLEFLPSGLRVVSRVLPLTYMTQGMRYALGVSEWGLASFWGVTAGLALFGVSLVPLLSRYVVRAGRD